MKWLKASAVERGLMIAVVSLLTVGTAKAWARGPCADICQVLYGECVYLSDAYFEDGLTCCIDGCSFHWYGPRCEYGCLAN